MRSGYGQKVVVAMSGGVDSSVAAALLKEQGYTVVGCFMRLGSDDSVEPPEFLKPPEAACGTSTQHDARHQGCCSLNDAADARLVAAMLDIPLYVLNFRRDFDRVIDYFVDEYNAGRTPNPCVRCNDWLKFGKLADYARSIDAAYVATGHYARVERIDGEPALLRGVDHAKDQSYVLFGTKREQLGHMLLPIGSFDKPQIRAMAEARSLPVFDKPDSQEICFVPDRDYAALVRRRSPDAVRPGEVVDTAGTVVGRHEGHQHFTIGQRRGVGVALGYPIYVTNVDARKNTVTVGPKQALAAGGLTAKQTNWLIDPPAAPLRCAVKVRYNSAPTPATVRVTGDDALAVEFDEPVAAVTPGQAVACYRGDRLIGGGWIERAHPVPRAD